MLPAERRLYIVVAVLVGGLVCGGVMCWLTLAMPAMFCTLAALVALPELRRGVARTA